MEQRPELLPELDVAISQVDLSSLTVEAIDSLPSELTTLTIKIKGDQFDGTITGEVARALWELQAAYYRVAATVLHGSSNIAALTEEERSSLELVFSVDKGCSEYVVHLGRFIKSILVEVVRNMDPKYASLVIVLTFALAVGGCNCHTWLENQKQIELKKLENAKDAEREKTIRESYERIENIVSDYASPLANVLESNAPKIAKAAHGATEVNVGNKHFDRSDIEELNKRAPRSKAKTETRSMSLKVRGFEYDEKSKRYKVKVTDVDSGEQFDAYITPSGIFGDLDEFSVPHTGAEISLAHDKKSIVEAEVLFTETKTKVERFILSWFDPNSMPVEKK